MASIDYFLGSDVETSPSAETLYSETLVKMRCMSPLRSSCALSRLTIL